MASRRCDLGVGCEEYGVCYAMAHGRPEQCGARVTIEDLQVDLGVAVNCGQCRSRAEEIIEDPFPSSSEVERRTDT